MAEYESVLCVIKECCVYKIPPRVTARGYRASDWNVEQFMWKGRLRVIAVGDNCIIQLEDGATGDLFARCPYDLEGTAVEQVLDSSRYFVIKIVDPGSGQHAFVGIGFPERSWAFDFNVALQDHVKRVRTARQVAEAGPKGLEIGPKIDYSLKDGQKIQINLGIGKNGPNRRTGAAGGGKQDADADLSQFAIIAPPPPPGASSSSSNLFSNASSFTAASNAPPARDDFGEFKSATQNSNSGTGGSFSGWTTF